MNKQEILNQISMLLGRLLSEVNGDKVAIAQINELLIAVGKMF